MLARLIGDTFADLTATQRTEIEPHLSLEPDRHPLIDKLYQQALNGVAHKTDAGWAGTLRLVLAALVVPAAGPVMPLEMLRSV